MRVCDLISLPQILLFEREWLTFFSVLFLVGWLVSWWVIDDDIGHLGV